MGFNVILLTPSEDFICSLNPEYLNLVENQEMCELTTLTISYPLSEDIQSDITKYFIQGNKIFINGAYDLKDGLYIIDEEVTDDLWKENNISVTLEDVLVELNYAPLISQLDVPNTHKLTKSSLENWFGDYYNINKFEEGVNSNFVELNGSMTLMSWLRSIEEQTGNVFRTNYEWDNKNKLIKRYLDFVKPVNYGKNHEDVISLGYNTDDIVYTVDESECYCTVSPVMSYDTGSGGITKSQLTQILKEYSNLDVSTGDIIPMILTKRSGAYPEDSSKKEGKITGSGSNINYWRRTPNDSTYSSIPYMLQYIGTLGNSGTWTSLTDSKANDNPGGYLKCVTDGTYGKLSLKVNDYAVSNGKTWIKLEFSQSGGSSEWNEATAFWSAPYPKDKNDLSIRDIAESKSKYTKIYNRPDCEEYVLDNAPMITVDGGDVPDGEEEEIIPDDDEDDSYKIATLKNGTCETSETDPYLIYHTCVQNLKSHNSPNVSVEVSLKDGTNSSNFELYDTIHVKIPSFDSLLNLIVSSTEKNPHMPIENKLTLKNVENEQSIFLVNPEFIVDDISLKHNVKKTFKGRLITTVEESDDKGHAKLVEKGLANKLVSLAISKPDSTRTTYITTYTRKVSGTTKKGKKTYYNKYGLSPDKKTVTGVGKVSAGRDKGKQNTFYKATFKNKCPKCGTPTLRWHYSKQWMAKKGNAAKWDGEFTCTYCDNDFSIEGHKKVNGSKLQLTKIGKITKSSKKSASKLVNGKLVYESSKSSSTVTNSTTKSSKKSTATVAGWNKVITTKTDKNGYFKFPLKLEGMENKDYTLLFTYGGDLETNSCTAKVSAHVPLKAATKTEYNVQKGPKKSKNRTYKDIKRPSGSKSYSGVVSNSVWKKANQIVGNSTGLTAMKKLANWISNRKNIPYIKKDDFYHSPYTTLKKGGNCCCKTDLFLQMCEAVGIFQCDGISAYYVNGPKHVYAQVAYKNSAGVKKLVYVDVTRTSKPWGHILKGYGGSPKHKSKYPKLPFSRGY